MLLAHLILNFNRCFCRAKSLKNHNIRRKMTETSGLAYIDVKDKGNPLSLFKEWFQEAQEAKIMAHEMNLATASKDGKVSNRTVMLREVTEDGFMFVTPENGKKCKHIAENPNVSLCFSWNYSWKGSRTSKQVRIEGIAEPISEEQTAIYFDTEPFYCKLRANLINNQGDPVNWEELKSKHDVLLKKVTQENLKLTLPKYYKGYKVVPQLIEFYYGYDNYIADRIQFNRNLERKWICTRIAT